MSASAVAAGCAGKVRFASFELAARTASKGARRNGAVLEAYSCEHCGGFHVGGTRGPRTGAIRSSAGVRHRCDACRRAGTSYCEHNRVLVVYINEAPVTIVSESQESARLTADRLRVKLKGKPFNRRRAECSDSPN